jgi:hypothetical protein
MPAPKRTPAKRAADLEIITRQYLSGISQAEIATNLALSQQQISYDLAQLRVRWLTNSQANIDQRKAEELAKIDVVEVENWAAWRRSCKDKETRTAETLTGDANRVKKVARTTGQSGNPEFLKGVQWCIEQRCKILGIVAPDTEVNVSVNTDVQVVDITKLSETEFQALRDIVAIAKAPMDGAATGDGGVPP